MAAAAQNAPERATQSKQTRSSGGFLQKLQNFPHKAGIALMVILLVIALPLGNYRALQKASPERFLADREVVSIVEDRAAEAESIIDMALAAFGNDAGEEARSAVDDLTSAKTARELSRADQALTTAISELTVRLHDFLSGSELTSLNRAADLFAEQGSFLRQKARSYNEKAAHAMEVYDRLPTRFLLSQPDMYEGI